MDAFFSRKKYLVCVDSDGCAMDTMNSKHIQCFGPCLVEEWELGAWREEILNRWNRINLYARTRGINRFKGLALMLEEIHGRYTPVAGIETLKRWIQETPALSEDALQQYLEKEVSGQLQADQAGITPDTEILRKALRWSRQVNRQIQAMPQEEKHAFPGVQEGLERAGQIADIAIVSSANRQAVEEEWQRCGLLELVDQLMTQEQGSKSRCIHRLLEQGYDPAGVLMVGDAMGDLEAARENGVLFYPILAGKEAASWRELIGQGLPHLEQDSYAGVYQQQKIREFQENFTS
ncbi:MAG: HAD hydrolase-like protein [Lachnospiraceae bacterium]|nr:HAD hydrolase-like protein [Lachnospiraceae bacterium]